MTLPGSFSFTLPDAIDIIATSILAYYLLLLIRGTRAVQIMLGLFVLVIVLALSNLLHLLVLATVMQYLLLGTAVTLPIVFQPELRRALEQIGRGGFLARPQTSDEFLAVTEAVAIISQAAFGFSRERIGALIVIEQATGLREFLESGTQLDARISIPLLASLFNPRSPLHDGAAIVRGATIESAGCYLPLSDAIVTDRHFGTRHRAALGLSEQTDAVIVVVSEETGFVSVARDGRLSVEIDDEERLRKVLVACVRETRSPRQAAGGILAKIRIPRANTRTEKLRT